MAPTRYPALHAYLTHSAPEYHRIPRPVEVRASLLAWYADNRRRLPWRGDAPPYNGSTAGTNAKAPTAAAAAAAAKAAAAPRTSADPPARAVSAYGTWVSEIMCQQTRVEAVIPYWLAWMEAFPTVHELAAASEEEVNARWAGLGFYRRARSLHEGAKQVVAEMDGQLPTTVDGLLRIQGIGPYTAGAIASISAGVAAPAVDGNVLRVFSRLCAVTTDVKDPAYVKLATELARHLVEADGAARPGELNQALMEIGATLCAPSGSGHDPRDPLAPHYLSVAIARDARRAHVAGELDGMLDSVSGGPHTCPVCKNGAGSFLCSLRDIARDAGAEERAVERVHALLPLPAKKKARREERYAVVAAQRDDGSWLLVKRPDGQLLAGQWEFPCTLLASDASGEVPPDPGATAHVEAARQLLADAGVERPVDDAPWGLARQTTPPVEHIFSHVRHTMHIHRLDHRGGEAVGETFTRGGRVYCWMAVEGMARVGVTAGVKKVMGACAQGSGGKSHKRARGGATPSEGQQMISAFFGKKQTPGGK